MCIRDRTRACNGNHLMLIGTTADFYADWLFPARGFSFRMKKGQVSASIYYCWWNRKQLKMRPVLSMGHILPCLFFIQSTSFSESKYVLILSAVVCQPVKWLPAVVDWFRHFVVWRDELELHGCCDLFSWPWQSVDTVLMTYAHPALSCRFAIKFHSCFCRHLECFH